MQTSAGQSETDAARQATELQGTRLVERHLPHLQLMECRFPAERDARRHVHDRPRLMAVLGGSVCESANGAGHIGGVGSVAIKPAGVWHADNFGRDGLHTLTLEFSPEFTECGVNLFDRLGSYRWFEGGQLFNRLARMSKELRDWGSDSQAIVEDVGTELLDYLGAVPVDGTAKPPQWLSTVEDYLHTNFHRTISVRAIATEVGVHHAHLHRAFRSRYGCAVGMFVRRLRVERAAHALRASNDVIAKIALDCGFSDQPHLTRVFRAWVGVTPAKFRAAGCF